MVAYKSAQILFLKYTKKAFSFEHSATRFAVIWIKDQNILKLKKQNLHDSNIFVNIIAFMFRIKMQATQMCVAKVRSRYWTKKIYISFTQNQAECDCSFIVYL